jgi:hypothetical protein
MRSRYYVAAILLIISATACSTLTLKSADFAWPIENALKVDSKGKIEEQRFSFSVNVKPLFFEEFKDSTNYIGKEIRIIRDRAGYYFITGKDFKNVYVFKPIENGMQLENKIVISEQKGLTNPAFNQKAPNIELLDNPNKYLLNFKGLLR